MKKKLLNLAIIGALGLALVSCGSDDDKTSTTTQITTTEKTSTTKVEDKTYTVNVYDIDSEKLGSYELKIEDGTSVMEQLKKVANVKSSESEWGTFVESIDKSYVGNGYYLALYENGQSSMTGIDGVTLDDGDVFDFKVEYYGDLDETDLLVDKAIHQYTKKYLGESFTNDAEFSNFWSYICYSLLGDNAKNYITLNSELSTYLDTFDVSTLTGTSYGKYFYTARAYGKNLDAYKTQYKTFLDSITEIGDYAEYSIPFETAPAKSLEISADIITKLKESEYKPGTSYGYDGANWFYQAKLLAGGSVDTSYLTECATANYENPTSLALSLASFSASDVSPRQEAYEVDGKDLVERLLESYDSNLGLVKYSSSDTGTNYSTNQIYASLISYKLFRDNGKAINIFE